MRKQFISGYQGQFDYEIDGKRYECRSSAFDSGQYMPGIYEREILPLVGTVRKSCSQEFPSDAVMALFPGYVAARWNPETKKMETKETPATGIRNGEVTAQAWIDELEALGL